MKKKRIELLTSSYDYYSTIKRKTDKIAQTVYHNDDEIFKSRLYNLVLNLCNQFLYDYTYIYTKRDLYFIADYNINIHKLLEEVKEDILIMRNKQ